MTDDERFALVLRELGDLLLALHSVGLGEDAVVIGAQVEAIEQMTRAIPPFVVRTAHGTEITRGFSFEPDLVIDTENEQQLEHLPEILRQCGFCRTGRSATWSKEVEGFALELDLFRTSPDVHPPTTMTVVRGAPLFRSRRVHLGPLSWLVADPYTFLSLKLEAKLRIRPEKTKDSFDMFAYVQVVSAEEINTSLDGVEDGLRVRAELRQLFGQTTGRGVRDVLDAAFPHGTPEERALLAEGVVDAFGQVLGTPPP